jgi:hypothetical protein
MARHEGYRQTARDEVFGRRDGFIVSNIVYYEGTAPKVALAVEKQIDAGNDMGQVHARDGLTRIR